MGSLFSRYPSCLACSRRDLLTRLASAHCFRGIHHTWCGLVAVFSHALHGFVVLIGGGGCIAGSRVERGRSVERDNMQLSSIMLSTTGYLRSSSPYHPHGAPILTICRTENTTRTEITQSVKACRNKYARHRNIRRETTQTEQKGNKSPSSLRLPLSSVPVVLIFYFFLFSGFKRTEVRFR